MTLPAVLPILGLEGITLLQGGHKNREEGVCLLEAVAWLAGEPHSDHPACACPIMTTIGRRLNDRITDDNERTALLRPLVALLAGSKSTHDVEIRRMYLAVDWSIREIVPQWMDLRPKLSVYATALRALAQIIDKTTADAAVPIVRAARDAARIERNAAYAAAYAADAADKSIITALVKSQRASTVDLLRRIAAVTA